MIIGNGDIARVLNDREGALFFASGVSNSQCNDKKQFEREWMLLYETVMFEDYGCLFYFSTISVDMIDTPYTRHKLEMESMVKDHATHYNIIRLGNISWGTNPNTFLTVRS